tara:strand:- start:494 stop:706 length:213 start_codon:yes stop_codon:yes gene_type:complete
MSLTPAYGRDYKSRSEVSEAWHKGQDFIINEIGNRWDGKPMNINQTAPGDSFEVRYSNLRKVAVVVGGAA